MEVGGVTAEDAARLQKKDDIAYIKMAELDGVMKDINLALKWRMREIEMKTDSTMVDSSEFTGERRWLRLREPPRCT